MQTKHSVYADRLEINEQGTPKEFKYYIQSPLLALILAPFLLLLCDLGYLIQLIQFS